MAIDPHDAARAGKAAALRAFVGGGGDINFRGQGQLDRAPLHVAIESKNVAVARLLIELDADVNAEDYRKARPLHYAAGVGLTALVEILLKRGADPKAVNTFGATALHEIASGGGTAPERDQVRIVRRLIAAGAEVDATENAGRTPLWYAATRGKVAVAKLLLDAGADPSKRAGGDQGTPKDAAVGNEVARLLAGHDSTTV
jgi:ankyrin repeat protein